MKELSLHVLDVAKNSVKAGATLTKIEIERKSDGMMTIRISDNGCGMTEEVVRRVTDPFYTTRTTRSVGLGLPLWRLAAEQTGGYMTVESSVEKGNSGTTVTAVFDTNSIDCMPMGDIVSTVCVLISGSPEVDFLFTDTSEERAISLDTREMREVLGEDVSLALPEVQLWIAEYLSEQYNNKNE